MARKNESVSSILITGLGLMDFAMAAAIAVRHYSFKSLRITCTSKARLPMRLAEYANGKETIPEILITGIALDASLKELISALNHLAEQGTKVKWFSTKPPPQELNDAPLEVYYNDKQELHRIVAEHLNAYPTPIEAVKHLYEPLFEASQYAFRNYSDSTPYHNVINHIAALDTESHWSSSEKQLLKFYLDYGNRELIGGSAAIKKLKTKLIQAAKVDNARVLIIGESGTGKETIALQIHQASPRKEESFIAFNCASVSPELLESRFLGYEKGAFTGANERREGIFEIADGGTLFLDEIGELPLPAQGVLLRILEEGRFFRMGGKTEISVNVRVIAATNRNLVEMAANGSFREDLYYRLAVVELQSPPLRERKDDIRRIADKKWTKLGHNLLTDEQAEALSSYDWPGNVRELMNLLERAHVFELTDFTGLITQARKRMAPLSQKRKNTADKSELPNNMEEAMALHAKRVYDACGQSTGIAAKELGISTNTLRKYLAQTHTNSNS